MLNFVSMENVEEIQILTAQSARTIEYTDCISAEWNIPHEGPIYDIKQSGCEAPVMRELLGMCACLFFYFKPFI